MSIAIPYPAVGIGNSISEDGHPTIVADGKCLIPQRKRLLKNRRAIFMILAIENIHPIRYVSSLTVPEFAP